MNTAIVLEFIFEITSSLFNESVEKLTSTKTGLNPKKIIEVILKPKHETIISPPLEILFKAAIVNKLADEPEFTNILYFTPSQFDHFFQIF